MIRADLVVSMRYKSDYPQCPRAAGHLQRLIMSAKRLQLADGTWQALDLFSRDSTKTFPERADESFADLLAKPGRAARGTSYRSRIV